MAHPDPEPYINWSWPLLTPVAPTTFLFVPLQVRIVQESGRTPDYSLSQYGLRRRVIVDGAVRDVAKMKAMKFPVFARGMNPSTVATDSE